MKSPIYALSVSCNIEETTGINNWTTRLLKWKFSHFHVVDDYTDFAEPDTCQLAVPFERITRMFLLVGREYE